MATDNGDGMHFWLKCTQDADIWESIPEDHGGHVSHKDRIPILHEYFLIVGKIPEYSRKRILIQFEDIPQAYRGWQVKWAKMYIYYYRSHKATWQKVDEAPSIPRELQVHQMLKSWNENEVTSEVRLRDTEWNEPFVALDDEDAASAPIDSVTVCPQRPPGYVEFDVTDAVSDWFAGNPNYGLLIWATNEDDDGREIRVRGRKHNEENEQPKLLVQCSK